MEKRYFQCYPVVIKLCARCICDHTLALQAARSYELLNILSKIWKDSVNMMTFAAFLAIDKAEGNDTSHSEWEGKPSLNSPQGEPCREKNWMNF